MTNIGQDGRIEWVAGRGGLQPIPTFGHKPIHRGLSEWKDIESAILGVLDSRENDTEIKLLIIKDLIQQYYDTSRS